MEEMFLHFSTGGMTAPNNGGLKVEMAFKKG